LLWNGGIGTYIKASREDHRDAADKANDRLRRDAPDVRAKVIGEGGNLGVTQKGRIEYALLGGRINTDAIDNAGGVNLSDREVNLKVLFSPLLKRGDLKFSERNVLLRQICQEVVDKVVKDNEVQALRLSLDEIRSEDDIFTFGRVIKALKRDKVMDPGQESLPATKLLISRASQGQGLARPELATVGSYVKMWVYNDLVSGERIDGLFAERFLRQYFPEAVTERFWSDIENHLLLHEIVCTIQTNMIVDFAGVTFFHEVKEQTDAGVYDTARAYLFANEMLDAWGLRESILLQEGKASTDGVYRSLLLLEQTLRQIVLWLLDRKDGTCVTDLTETEFARMAKLASGVKADFTKNQSNSFTRRMAAEVKDLIGMGVSKKCAESVIRTRYLAMALPVANQSDNLESAKKAVRVYFSLGAKFGFLGMAERLGVYSSVDPWATVAVSGLGQEFRGYHDSLTSGVLKWQNRKDGLKSSVVTAFLETHDEFSELARLVKEAADNEPDVARLWVLGNRLVRAFREAKMKV
jgi:glutamate dehydrogenase